MDRKYEIDIINFGEKHYFASMIGMLTGRELEEIIEARDGKEFDRWRGREIADVFRNLGYNCNPRFKKFDKATEYPCLMRSHDIHDKSGSWYAFVYYDSFVYCPVNGKIHWHTWNKWYPQLRVTSMMQVWI